MWEKIKSLGWVATLGSVIGAVLLALAGVRAQKEKANIAKKEERIENLLMQGSQKAIDEAQQLNLEVKEHKTKAAEADKKVEKELEKLGEKNESINDIATRFNSKRVRRK